jgi:lysozyme
MRLLTEFNGITAPRHALLIFRQISCFYFSFEKKVHSHLSFLIKRDRMEKKFPAHRTTWPDRFTKRGNEMRKRYWGAIGAILFAIIVFLEYKGFIWHNELFALGYQVRGLDVSHHQGEIDWQKVRAEREFQFVYIKATEGKEFVDDRFLENWNEAKKQGFRVGAYHYFSMKSSGREQADHFIHTVPPDADSLPPAIDVEIPANLDKNRVSRELHTMADALEHYYGKKPVLYVTYKTYQAYIHDDFAGYGIWIRDIYKSPSLDNRPWLFWQYGNRGRVDGIPTYVDLNVFRGDVKEFQQAFNQ